MLTSNHFLGLMMSSLACQLIVVFFCLDTVTPRISEEAPVPAKAIPRSHPPPSQKIPRNKYYGESSAYTITHFSKSLHHEETEMVQWAKTLVILISVIACFTFCYHSFFLEDGRRKNGVRGDRDEENDDYDEDDDGYDDEDEENDENDNEDLSQQSQIPTQKSELMSKQL